LKFEDAEMEDEENDKEVNMGDIDFRLGFLFIDC
jgi:hypothetical protein